MGWVTMKVLYVDAISARTTQSNIQGILGGYKALGHQVKTFDYRAIALRLGKDKSWDKGRGFWSQQTVSALQRMNRSLVDAAVAYQPDFIHLGKCEFVSNEAMREIKDRTHAYIVHLYLDLSEEPKFWVVEIGKYADWTLLCHQDDGIVAKHLEAGCQRIGFWMPGTDASIFKPSAPKTYDVVFMGNRILRSGMERDSLLSTLAQAGCDVHVHGRHWAHLRPSIVVHGFVEHQAFAEAVSAARLGLSYNTSEFRMYASWRRILNTMACGTMLLCRYFPGLETVFRNREDLVWFNDEDEAVELALRYLEVEDERERIAASGRREVLANHTWERMVGELVALGGVG